MLIETGKILDLKCHNSSITSLSCQLIVGTVLLMARVWKWSRILVIVFWLTAVSPGRGFGPDTEASLFIHYWFDPHKILHRWHMACWLCMWTSSISYLKLFLTASSFLTYWPTFVFLIKIIFGIIRIIQFDKHSSTSPATCLKYEMMISLYKCIFSQSIRPHSRHKGD